MAPAVDPAAPASDELPETGSAVDLKGVPFHDKFCGKATEPFYSSGPREGQWKKRKGVAEDTYDKWYASELEKLGPPGGEEEPAPLNTAGAFSSQTPQKPAPTDAGSLMGWIAEKQAAGNLTLQQVQDAYTQASLAVTDLFPPNDENMIRQRVQTLHGILSVQAGA